MTRGRPVARLGPWRKLAFGLVTPLIFLSGLELGARLLLDTPEQTVLSWRPSPVRAPPGSRPSQGMFIPDAETLWTLRPGGSLGGKERVNHAGYRDTPIGDKEPGEIRILSLGDSSVYGAGVAREDTFSELLEAWLDPEGIAGQHRIQVINAGVPGYSTYQCMTRLRRAIPLGIDGVILYTIGDRGVAEGVSDDDWFRKHWPVQRLVNRSALLLHAQTWLAPERAGGKLPPQSLAHSDANRVHVRYYRENLREIAATARSAGAWVVYVVAPIRNDLTGSAFGFDPRLYSPEEMKAQRATALDTHTIVDAEDEALVERRLNYLSTQESYFSLITDYRATLSLVTRQNQIPLVDATARFRAIHNSPDAPALIQSDGVHPTTEGHRVLAEALLPVVRGALDEQAR